MQIYTAGQGMELTAPVPGQASQLQDKDAAQVPCRPMFAAATRSVVLQASAHSFLFLQAAVVANYKGLDSRHILWPAPAEHRHQISGTTMTYDVQTSGA